MESGFEFEVVSDTRREAFIGSPASLGAARSHEDFGFASSRLFFVLALLPTPAFFAPRSFLCVNCLAVGIAIANASEPGV